MITTKELSQLTSTLIAAVSPRDWRLPEDVYQRVNSLVLRKAFGEDGSVFRNAYQSLATIHGGSFEDFIPSVPVADATPLIQIYLSGCKMPTHPVCQGLQLYANNLQSGDPV